MPATTHNASGTEPAPPPVSLSTLLHNRDVPCPHCHYNLRNLTADRCPECGHPLSIDLLLNPPPRFDHAHLLALLSSSIGVVTSFSHWRHFLRWHRLDYSSIGASPLAAFVSGLYWLSLLPLFILLLLSRTRFSRLPHTLRYSLAIALALLCLLFHRRYLLLFFS